MSEENAIVREYGSGSGVDELFIVEARTSYSCPEVHCGMILDREWRQVHFPKSSNGVKTITFNPQADRLGLLNYEAALALAVWFMAEPAGGPLATHVATHAYCIETRLVKVKLTYSYSTKEVGIGETMSAINMHRAAKFTPRDDGNPR